MTKKFMAILALLALASCATPITRESLWPGIQSGQTKAQVIQIMGQPDGFTKDDGKDILVWGIDRFEKCAVLFGKDGRVEGKTCKDNVEARTQAMSAIMQMQPQRVTAPTFTPMQPYQMRTPSQTNCTSNSIGGSTYTNCQGH